LKLADLSSSIIAPLLEGHEPSEYDLKEFEKEAQ
jgi:hypothetical protein